MLQCGHGPKTVENATQVRVGQRRHNRALQCGHGPKTVENPSPSWYPTLNLCVQVASMRPRPKDRGERRSDWRSANRMRSPRLQCGHGPKTVENDTSGHPRSTAVTGFNAATAQRPWEPQLTSIASCGESR